MIKLNNGIATSSTTFIPSFLRGQTPPCSEASSSKIMQVNCASSLQAKVFGGPGPQCEGTGPFFSRCLAATFCTVDPGPPTKLVQTSRLDPYLIFVIFLHRQNFWKIKFTPKKRVNYDKIHRKLPIFCVITVKYTVNCQFFALNL